METTLHQTAERIDNLEMKVAYQDQVIDELNKAVVAQWNRIELLQALIDGLEKRLREAQSDAGRDPQDEPPPPHW